MSNKKFPTPNRLTELERRMEIRRQENLATADRSSLHAAKRHIKAATTFDDGEYPPDPGDGQRGQPHVLPVIFDDAEYSLVAGAQSAIRYPLDNQRMDYVLCTRWYPPGTTLVGFHQNRRWFEIATESSVSLQKILLAEATLETASNCAATLSVNNLVYKPFGIFQLPWDEQTASQAQQWNDGTDQQWNDGEPIEWRSSGTVITVDNPARLCGQVGDTVILHYQGDDLDPMAIQILHRCYDIQEIEYDPVNCILSYKDRTVCSPVVSEPTAGPGTPLIDFDNQTVVIDVGWDPTRCEFYNVYQDFCVITSGPPSEPLHWLDIRDLQDPCCPCPPCPTDCSSCQSAYLMTINNWSTPDCGCMNVVQLALDRRGVNGCAWDSPGPICTVGSLLATIECVNNRWILTIDYNTAGTANDVYVDNLQDPVDMGPADDCPPTGTWPVNFTYTGGSTICTTTATQVTIE